MFSQQSSLRPRRTALVCQAAMAATEAASLGPSKKPKPSIQAYSVPDRLTPAIRTGAPAPFTIWLPTTCRPLIDDGVAANAGTPIAGLTTNDIARPATSTAAKTGLVRPGHRIAFIFDRPF